VGVSGAGLDGRLGAVVRVRVVAVLRLAVLVPVLRRRRPGMVLPSSSGTVSGGTDGTSDGIAG
jgi:hypothetical protein